jgi:ribosome recycling factor
MTIADVKKSVEQKMQKSIETLKNDLGKVRTGRAHTGLLDHVKVDYYGNPTPINQVANLTLIDARTIGVQPWEKKMVAAVEKAIRDSKVVRGEAESARVAIRNVRREGNEHLKKLLKDKVVSEDDERRAQDEVQKLTDRFIAEVDKMLAAKEAELMAV